MRRVVLRFALIYGVIAACLVTAPAPASAQPSAAAHNPVVFVHGWAGADWNWHPLMDDFVEDGWSRSRLFSWSYDWSLSNVTIARRLATKIDRVLAETGASKVDIVAHSMGSLSSRWYIKYLGGDQKVDNWISLAGPNHGTVLSSACSWLLASCRDMKIGSEFLAVLNEGDETPGDVRYRTLWSWCDEFITPDSSVVLAGADNVQVGCVEHAYFLVSGQISQHVRDLVR
jgi:triacylglycerol lipase